MRISDWSSDVCSSDLPWVYCTTPTARPRGGCCCRSPRSAESSICLICASSSSMARSARLPSCCTTRPTSRSAMATSPPRSEEHTSELQSLMRISYAVFCLKKKKKNTKYHQEYIDFSQLTQDSLPYTHHTQLA